MNFFSDFFYFFLTGTSVGLVGFLFGLGGGILIVPILSFLGYSMQDSIATSLTIIVFNSVAVSIEKLRKEEIDLSISGALELSGVAGAILGGLVAQVLPSDVLKRVFSFFTVLMAFLVARGRDQTTADVNETDAPIGNIYPQSDSPPKWSYLMGAMGGAISALLGIGSGALMVPLLNLVGKMPFKVATGTSSYVSGIFALVGAVVLFEHIQIDLVPVLLVSVRLGTFIGGKYLQTATSKVLRRIFAILLCIISMKMWS